MDWTRWTRTRVLIKMYLITVNYDTWNRHLYNCEFYVVSDYEKNESNGGIYTKYRDIKDVIFFEKGKLIAKDKKEALIWYVVNEEDLYSGDEYFIGNQNLCTIKDYNKKDIELIKLLYC